MLFSICHFPQRRFLFIIALFTCSLSFSQGFQQNIYKEGASATTTYDHYSTAITPSGGLLIAGLEPTSPSGDGCVLHSLDAQGNVLWSVKNTLIHNFKVIAAQNGDALVCGNSSSLGTPGYTNLDGNTLLLRFTPAGQLSWAYAYGNQRNDHPFKLHELSNGTIEIIGITNDSAGGGGNAPYRMRISPTGTLLQTDIIRLTPVTNFDWMAYDPASGKYLAFTSGRVALIDTSFNLVWMNDYSTSVGSPGFRTAAFSPGGDIVLGGFYSNAGDYYGFLVVLDVNGSVLSSSCYVNGDYCLIRSVAVLPSGNIAVTGGANDLTEYTYNNQYRMRAFAFIADPTGQVLNSAVFHHELSSEGLALNLKNDSTLVITGDYSNTALEDGFFCIKTNTALWQPPFCSFPAGFTDSAVVLTTALLTPAIQPMQITLAAPAVFPFITNPQPLLVHSCPTKTLLREQDDGYANVAASVHDGNVVVAGYEMISGTDRPAITKYNPEGDEIWSYEYDHGGFVNSDKWPFCILETADRGIVMAGGARTAGSSKLFILKTDSMGQLLWGDARYGTNTQTYFIKNIREDASHNLVGVTGFNFLNTTAARRMGMIKYDSLGNFLWSKIYTSNFSYPTDVLCNENSYFLSGWNDTLSHLIKTDTAGNVIWSKEVTVAGPNNVLQVSALASAAGDQLIVAGAIRNANFQPSRPIVMRMDTAGNLLWAKELQLPAAQSSYVRSITPFKGDRFLLTIHADDGSVTNYRSYIVLMRANGSIQWSTLINYDAQGGMGVNNTALAKDSAIIVPVTYQGFYIRHRFLKMTRFGQGPCGTSAVSMPTITPVGLIIQPSALTATAFALTSQYLNPFQVVDSLFCLPVCSTRDTSYYSGTGGGVGIFELTVSSAWNNGLILFPNPATDFVTVRSARFAIKRVVVFSNTGQEIATQGNGYAGTEQQMSLEGLAPGCYFIRVELENGGVENIRCVKTER